MYKKVLIKRCGNEPLLQGVLIKRCGNEPLLQGVLVQGVLVQGVLVQVIVPGRCDNRYSTAATPPFAWRTSREVEEWTGGWYWMLEAYG